MLIPTIDNAKVMSKGQITIPKEIRDLLQVSEGDKVTFIWQGDYAVVMNAGVYAARTHDALNFQQLQRKAVYDFFAVNSAADNELTSEDFAEFESGKFKLIFPQREFEV